MVHPTTESNSIAEPELRNFGARQSEVHKTFLLCTTLAFRLLLKDLKPPHNMPLFVQSIAGNMTKHSLVRLSSSNSSSRILFRAFSLSSSNSSQAALRAASIDCGHTQTRKNRQIRRHEHTGAHAHAHTYKQTCKQTNRREYCASEDTSSFATCPSACFNHLSLETGRMLCGMPRNHPVISRQLHPLIIVWIYTLMNLQRCLSVHD